MIEQLKCIGLGLARQTHRTAVRDHHTHVAAGRAVPHDRRPVTLPRPASPVPAARDRGAGAPGLSGSHTCGRVDDTNGRLAEVAPAYVADEIGRSRMSRGFT